VSGPAYCESCIARPHERTEYRCTDMCLACYYRHEMERTRAYTLAAIRHHPAIAGLGGRAYRTVMAALDEIEARR
jgi:hypothetical protein